MATSVHASNRPPGHTAYVHAAINKIAIDNAVPSAQRAGDLTNSAHSAGRDAKLIAAAIQNQGSGNASITANNNLKLGTVKLAPQGTSAGIGKDSGNAKLHSSNTW